MPSSRPKPPTRSNLEEQEQGDMELHRFHNRVGPEPGTGDVHADEDDFTGSAGNPRSPGDAEESKAGASDFDPDIGAGPVSAIRTPDPAPDPAPVATPPAPSPAPSPSPLRPVADPYIEVKAGAGPDAKLEEKKEAKEAKEAKQPEVNIVNLLLNPIYEKAKLGKRAVKNAILEMAGGVEKLRKVIDINDRSSWRSGPHQKNTERKIEGEAVNPETGKKEKVRSIEDAFSYPPYSLDASFHTTHCEKDNHRIVATLHFKGKNFKDTYNDKHKGDDFKIHIIMDSKYKNINVSSPKYLQDPIVTLKQLEVIANLVEQGRAKTGKSALCIDLHIPKSGAQLGKSGKAAKAADEKRAAAIKMLKDCIENGMPGEEKERFLGLMTKADKIALGYMQPDNVSDASISVETKGEAKAESKAEAKGEAKASATTGIGNGSGAAGNPLAGNMPPGPQQQAAALNRSARVTRKDRGAVAPHEGVENTQ